RCAACHAGPRRAKRLGISGRRRTGRRLREGSEIRPRPAALLLPRPEAGSVADILPDLDYRNITRLGPSHHVGGAATAGKGDDEIGPPLVDHSLVAAHPGAGIIPCAVAAPADYCIMVREVG